MTIHDKKHELAGQTVTISAGEFEGQEYRIEDWWDRVSGESWQFAKGNPACIQYAVRSAVEGWPVDDEVVYGKIDHLGYLIHVSQLPKPETA